MPRLLLCLGYPATTLSKYPTLVGSLVILLMSHSPPNWSWSLHLLHLFLQSPESHFPRPPLDTSSYPFPASAYTTLVRLLQAQAQAKPKPPVHRTCATMVRTTTGTNNIPPIFSLLICGEPAFPCGGCYCLPRGNSTGRVISSILHKICLSEANLAAQTRPT